VTHKAKHLDNGRFANKRADTNGKEIESNRKSRLIVYDLAQHPQHWHCVAFFGHEKSLQTLAYMYDIDREAQGGLCTYS